MTDAVRYPLVLGVISLCSAAGLALSYSLTRDEIRHQEELKKARGLAEVFGVELDEQKPERPWREFKYPDPNGELGGDFSVYELLLMDTERLRGAPGAERGMSVLIGYVPTRRLYGAEGKAQGYSSKVAVVVASELAPGKGFDAATTKAVKVVKHLETPGLGSRCTEPEFQRQFRNLPCSLLELIKSAPYRDPEKAESARERPAAITGATITSNAVIGAIRQALARIRYHIENRSAEGGLSKLRN